MGEARIERKTKVCTKCGRRKYIATGYHFARMKNGKPCSRTICKKCRYKSTLAWQRANPEKRRRHWAVQKERRTANGHIRDSYYRWKYGITLQEYQQLSKRQRDLCGICGHPEMSNGVNGKIRVLAVDHDHETKRVRGLLCFLCNAMLGNIEKIGMERIIRYMEGHK